MIWDYFNSHKFSFHNTKGSRRTVCVTCVWAGVDNAWEQKKLEARKMLENAAESHTSGARFVGRILNENTFAQLLTTLS
jgi:hypothetical protein